MSVEDLKKFKMLADNGDWAYLQCLACQKPFIVDVTVEENLILWTRPDGSRILIEKCPRCGMENRP